MLDFRGMRSSSSMPLIPGPLWFGVVISDMGQIELLYIKIVYLCKTELFEIELFDNV